MKKLISLILVLSLMLCAVPKTVFGADYNCTVTHIPDNSDATVYMLDDYFYIGDDTIMHEDGIIVTSGKYKFGFNSWSDECFENGYIQVQDKTTGLMGLMNEKGEMVTEVKYSLIEVFNEKGEAIACIDGEKYGMIDKDGNVLIPFEFDYIRRCNHDELLVAGRYKYSDDPNANIVREMYYGLIDRKGNVVLPIEYEDIDFFDRYGFIKTSHERGWSEGLVNSKGEVVLEIKYRNIVIYNDGEYIAAWKEGDKRYWFDKDGNDMFPQYDNVWNLGEGLLLTKKDGKSGIAKYDGTIIFEPIYDNVEATVNIGFIMLEKDGKTQWANASGEILYDAHYEDCDELAPFDDEVYALKQYGLWAVAIGEKVGEFKYTEIDDSSYYGSILFCTKQNGSIDGVDCLTGEVIYENAFKDKYTKNYYYKENDETYLISRDKTLTPAWPDKYVYVGEFENNVAVAKNHENLWGLINEKGEPITEFKYESFYVCVGVNHGSEVMKEHIYSINEGLVLVMLDGKIGYINLKGEMVIEPKFDWPVFGGYGWFEHGYAQQVFEGKECYIDREGNIYEQGRIILDNYPVASRLTDSHYALLYKDGNVEIWDEITNERIMFSAGNALYKEDGSFLVDTILKNDKGNLKIRYEYDKGISVWTEFGRFIIDIEE